MNAESQIRKLLVKISEDDDKNAFSKLFSYYHPRLIRFALLFLKSYQDAEDVVSEVMIKVLRQRTRLNTIKNFEGYLYLSIRNQAINLNKKISHFRNENIQDIKDDYLTSSYIQPLETILEDELRTLVTKTVEMLPPQRRMVYKMVKDDELSCREVAQLLNIAEKTVKKHLELAIKDLKKSLEEYYAERKSATPVIHITKHIGVTILFLEVFRSMCL